MLLDASHRRIEVRSGFHGDDDGRTAGVLNGRQNECINQPIDHICDKIAFVQDVVERSVSGSVSAAINIDRKGSQVSVNDGGRHREKISLQDEHHTNKNSFVYFNFLY